MAKLDKIQVVGVRGRRASENGVRASLCQYLFQVLADALFGMVSSFFVFFPLLLEVTIFSIKFNVCCIDVNFYSDYILLFYTRLLQ